jgi:hypothetical protein
MGSVLYLPAALTIVNRSSFKVKLKSGFISSRDLEEELTVVGKNLQQLEVGEEQTRVREEKLQAQIMDLR